MGEMYERVRSGNVCTFRGGNKRGEAAFCVSSLSLLGQRSVGIQLEFLGAGWLGV